MNEPRRDDEPTSLSNRDRYIAERLRSLVSEGAAQFFEDACTLLRYPNNLKTTAHLVAHALREIESALRAAFSPIVEPGEIPKTAASEKHHYRVEHALRQLGISEADPAARAWLELARKDSGLARLAHRNGLQSARALEDETRETLEKTMLVFARILDRAETSWHSVLAKLDLLALLEHPSKSDADELLLRLPNTARTRQLFFGKTTSAGWLPHLIEAGIFSRPPAVLLDDEAGTIAFPFWSEGEYLARMAAGEIAATHALVLQAVDQVPGDSENIRVAEELTAVALALPADLSVGLVPRLSAAFPTRYFSRLPDRCGALSVRLAEADHADEAFQLAECLLGHMRDTEEARYEPLALDEYRHPPEPRPRVPGVMYAHVARQMIPGLRKHNAERSTQLARRLLVERIQLGRRSGELGPQDLSHAWLRNLEDGPKEHEDDPKLLLAFALRDGLLAMLTARPERLSDVVDELLSEPASICHRFALHFLMHMAPIESTQLRTALMNTAAMDDPDTSSEYAELLEARFGELPAADRQLVAESLSHDLPDEEIKEHLRFWSGSEPTPDEMQGFRDRRLATRLAPIGRYLLGEQKERFDAAAALAATESRAPMPPPGFGDDDSPKTAEELLEMADADLVAYVSKVELGDHHYGPSRRGLSSVLQEVVKRAPARLAGLAIKLVDLDPAYLSGYFDGLAEAITSGASIAWGPPLALAVALSSRPRLDMAESEPGAPDESWSRTSILRWLNTGMERESSGLLTGNRSAVWAVIAGLLRDPRPTAAEAGAALDLDGQLSLALNSVRGGAVGAIPRYVGWLSRALKQTDNPALSLQDVPQVRSALESLLKLESEPVFALRYILGERFGWWYRLDSEWAAAHREDIFPLEAGREAELAVTWGTYLRYLDVSLTLYPLLEPVYRHSAAMITTGLAKDELATAERLGFHLCKLGWLGTIDIGATDSPLVVFFDRADPKLRQSVLDEVGRLLHRTKEDIPQDAVKEFMRLWEWRRSTIQRTSSDPSELAAFGWWFSAGKLPDYWALRELEHATKLAGGVEFAHLAIERLAVVAAMAPSSALRSLESMLVGNRHGFGFELSQDQARSIITSGLTSEDAVVRRQARELASRFTAHGYDSFRDLASELG